MDSKKSLFVNIQTQLCLSRNTWIFLSFWHFVITLTSKITSPNSDLYNSIYILIYNVRKIKIQLFWLLEYYKKLTWWSIYWNLCLEFRKSGYSKAEVGLKGQNRVLRAPPFRQQNTQRSASLNDEFILHCACAAHSTHVMGAN